MSRPHSLPADWRIALDPGLRRVDGGSVLIGGSPLRILRLTSAGQRLVDELDHGEPIPQSNGAQDLVRRLLDAGMAHPRPGASTTRTSDVTIVVPVHDQPINVTVDRMAEIIVVDDGSRVPIAHSNATVIRTDHARGPAAARNTGWRRATTELVAFLDADCEPEPDWLDRLLPHFGDPQVGAVAPRITTTLTSTLPPPLARYEQTRPTLDRGDHEAIVRPRSPVPFVPTTALVVRRTALDAVEGFDETMRFGEDVDFVWRLATAGWTVRYEPRVQVGHPGRPTTRSWLRQRFDYGTSAAPLARKHGTAVAPLAVSAWSAFAWALAGVGHPVTGATIAAATTARLAPRLNGLHDPWSEAARLAGGGHLHAGTAIADAVRRPWWPFAIAAAALSRRARRGVLAAAIVPPLLEWRARRPALDPVQWTALRVLDDAAYGAGVWAGCVRERSFAALRPDLASWPDRRPAIESAGDTAQRASARFD